ncbi:MAG: TIM barrel protein, partial [Promethearchaeota archaeon]
MSNNGNGSIKRRLGISTYVGCEETIEAFFQRCEKLGVAYVEVLCEKPMALPVDVTQRERKQIRELLESYSLTPIVQAPYFDINIASLNSRIGDASMQQIKEAILFAADIEAT